MASLELPAAAEEVEDAAAVVRRHERQDRQSFDALFALAEPQRPGEIDLQNQAV
jgi:hypothetical protein